MWFGYQKKATNCLKICIRLHFSIAYRYRWHFTSLRDMAWHPLLIWFWKWLMHKSTQYLPKEKNWILTPEKKSNCNTYRYFKDLQLIKDAPGNVFNLFMLNALTGGKTENSFIIDLDVKGLWNKNWNAIRVAVKVRSVARGRGVMGYLWPPFVSHVLSKQPTTGGTNDMKIWRVTSFWHRVTHPPPPPPLKNPGYAPGQSSSRSLELPLMVLYSIKVFYS